LLPPHMIPSAWMTIEAIPRTPTNKADRRVLPTPEPGGGVESVGYREPTTETERRLATVFAELLGIARIGVDDSFFATGGTSLQAIRGAAKVSEEFGVELSVRDFYTAPTVADLGELIDLRAHESQANAVTDWDLLSQIENLSDEEVARLLAAEE